MCSSSTFHSVLRCAQLKLLYHHLHPATFLLSILAVHLHPENVLSPFYRPTCPTRPDILIVICAIIQVALVYAFFSNASCHFTPLSFSV
jgi:hypothetical protein